MADGAIYKAIPAIMAEIGAISKDRTNEAQRYKFRGIDDVYNAIHPLLIKHKVFTVPEILEEKDSEVETAKGTRLFYARLKIKYTFYADDGSFLTAVVRGEGMDSGDKASNKAMAVAHKYALLQTFAIPTEEGADPENDSHDVKAAGNGGAAPETVETTMDKEVPRSYWTKRDKAVLFEFYGPALDYRVEKHEDGKWYGVRIDRRGEASEINNKEVPF